MRDLPPSSDEQTDIDRQIRIEKMKNELDQIAGGEILSGSFGPVFSALEESFLEQVLAFERADLDTNFNRLVQRGVALLPLLSSMIRR